LAQKKNIIKKKVQGQSLGFMVIWVLFFTTHSKKIERYRHNSFCIVEFSL
jgi:hypothetical protein